MFLLRLIRYFRGSVRFKASGPFAERFVNLAARAGIPLWDFSRQGESFFATAYAAGYKKLRHIATKSGSKIRIQRKNGAPFVRQRYRNRLGLPAGIFVFTVFLFVMSSFIWRIEVNGLDTLPESRVLSAFEELGIRPGRLRAGIDVRDCERRALLKIPELAWVALNIDGSTATIEVSERVLPPVVIDAHDPCNIIAAKSGQITAMRVYEGQAMTEVGFAVQQGDLLISGITQDSFEKNLFRHARGEIIARTIHEIQLSVPLKQQQYIPTGEVKKRNFLELLGINLPLFLPSGISGFYHIERESSPLILFGAKLPIQLHRRRYNIMQQQELVLDDVAAKEQALRELAAIESLELAGAEILERSMSGFTENGHFNLTAVYDCIMDIGEQRKIAISGGNEIVN